MHAMRPNNVSPLSTVNCHTIEKALLLAYYYKDATFKATPTSLATFSFRDLDLRT